MEPPTITQKQAKKTLSGKKAKRETIKNVLVKPYDHYWPLLNPEDNNQLIETLLKLLPRLKNDKTSVPFDEIKKIPKNERKKFRETFQKEDLAPIDKNTKTSIIFGVNDAARAIEKQEVGSLLISNDVKPRLMVEHVLDLAVLYNVPVLVVNELRDVFKKKCGICGAVVAFKNCIKANSELGLIQQSICNIYENYPVPETHVNYHRRKDTNPIVIYDSSEDALPPSFSVTDDKRCSSVITIRDESDEEMAPGRSEARKNYHLQRVPNRKRAFVPETCGFTTSSFTTGPMVIHFNNPGPSGFNNHNNNNNKTKYRPLMVKRVKGDKNRNKRKLEKFKKK